MTWADDEGITEDLLEFINSRITWYQTKAEFIRFLGDGSCIEELELTGNGKVQLAGWFYSNTVASLREENQKLVREIHRMRFPPPPPKIEYDEERYGAFVEDLLLLLKKHRVEISVGYDGDWSVEDCDGTPEIFGLENEITKS